MALKSWTQLNFCKNPHDRYTRVRVYNVSKSPPQKTWKLDNAKPTHEIVSLNLILTYV